MEITEKRLTAGQTCEHRPADSTPPDNKSADGTVNDVAVHLVYPPPRSPTRNQVWPDRSRVNIDFCRCAQIKSTWTETLKLQKKTPKCKNDNKNK